MDKEFVIGLLLVMFVFIVALLFFMKVWTLGGNETSTTQGISADCSKWLSETPACREQEIEVSGSKYKVIPDRYTALKKVYAKETDPLKQQAAYVAARAYCNCP